MPYKVISIWCLFYFGSDWKTEVTLGKQNTY